MPMVTVRYWAAAKQAAGVAEEEVQAETLSGALTAVVARRQPEPGAGLRAVLDRSSFLIDGDPAGGRAPETVALREAAVIEVLPPFAGG